MTLPDQEEVKMTEGQKKENNLANIMTTVLDRAKRDNRVVASGIYECATYLESDSDHVMLCVLPETVPSDLAMSIQHKLIEAFCLENDVQVIKVNSCEKVSHLLSDTKPQQVTLKDNPVTTASLDCSCVLIGWPPKHKKNRPETRLLELIWPNQHIDFPM